MKITIEQKAGVDYPATFKDNESFHKHQKETFRRKLQLQSEDTIEIKEL